MKAEHSPTVIGYGYVLECRFTTLVPCQSNLRSPMVLCRTEAVAFTVAIDAEGIDQLELQVAAAGAVGVGLDELELLKIRCSTYSRWAFTFL